MTIKSGQRISGNYSNGIQTWNFSGTVGTIRNDECGGGFATARIALDEKFDGREGIIMTLDGRHCIADSRYTI